MRYLKKWMINLGIIGGLILLGSQIVVVNIVRLEPYGMMYKVRSVNDYYFFETLEFTLTREGYLYRPGTVDNFAYYNFVKLNDGSQERMLLKVTFNERYTGIADYQLYNLSLNKNKEYFGLATDGSNFWTLETVGYKTTDQRVICFTLAGTIVSNQSLPEPKISIEGFWEYHRTILGIKDNSLITWEYGFRFIDSPERYMENITQYDVQTLQMVESTSSVKSHPYRVFWEPNGLFWSEAEEDHIYSGSTTFVGYNLADKKIQKTITVDYYSRREGIHPYNGEIELEQPVFLFSEGTANNEYQSRPKIIFPLKLRTAPALEIPERLVGFRILPLEPDLFLRREQAYWAMGTGIGICCFALIGYYYWEEKKRSNVTVE
jgi:hypothetical protein